MLRKMTLGTMKRHMGLSFSIDPPGKEDSGGGAGGTTTAKSAPSAEDFAALKAELAALVKSIGKPAPKADDEGNDLGDKARIQRENDDKDSARTKRLESAITFNLKAKDFLSANESLLPKGVADIFAQAEKERFSDAIEKDAAIKAGIVGSFFSVQDNVDLLTPGLKSNLDDYLKLTKNGKQEKAQEIYQTIFEPAFEMLKRVKKAEALGKGFGGGTDAETAYKNKLASLSKKHYGLGDR